MQASIKTNPAHTPCRGHRRQADWACARAQRAYWKRQLAGAPELLELPTDHARPAVPSGRGGMVPFALPAALTQRLRYLAASTNATMFMIMVAAWQARCLLWCLGQACIAGHASTQAVNCMCGSCLCCHAPLIGSYIQASPAPSLCTESGPSVQVLLGRYARSDDVVIGTPLGNRSHPELEGLIGYFVNSAALRTDLSGAHA